MKKKITTLISDLDGTLYYDGKNSTNAIPEANVAAIRRWQKAGYRFILATGRTGNTIDYFKKEYDLKVDMIACNGGKIILDHQTVYASEISWDCVHRAKALLEPFGKEIDFVLDMDTQYKVALFSDGIISANYNQGSYPIYSIDEYSTRPDAMRPCKLFIPMKYPKRQAFFLNLLKKEFKDELSFSKSSSFTLECCNKGINKGTALLHLMKLCQLEQEEIAVIGDEENDLEMLKTAVNSYAMSHAREKIKQAAKHEIASVADLIDLCLKQNQE